MTPAQAFVPSAPIKRTAQRPTFATVPRRARPQSTTPTCALANPLRHAFAAALAALSTLTLRPTVAAPIDQPHVEQRVARASASPSALSVRPVRAKRPAHKPSAPAGGHGLEGQSFAVAGSAALFASAAAVSVTHPIDTLKTLRQARDQGLASDGKPVSIAALYKGVLSNILKEAPNAAIYLGTYEVFKDMLLAFPMFAACPLLAMCVAGMLGDAVGSVVRVPAEIINKRLQLGLSSNWASAVRDSFLSPNGVEGTFASWAAVLWRDVPYGGLQIAGYEFVRLSLAGFGFTGLLFNIIAGAVAGLFAAVLTTPADVLVTRMSTQSPQCYLETKSYMSPSATFFRIIREEGVGALWSGAMHRGLFYMPMIGLFFATYESFKHAISNPASVLAGLSAWTAAISPLLKAVLAIAAAVRLPSHLIVVAISQYCMSLWRKSATSAQSVRH